MKESTNLKIVRVLSPGAIVDNTSPTTTEINAGGCGHVTVVLDIGATDIAMVALKMQESDVSGSGYVDIPNLNFATGTLQDGTAATLPGAGDDNHFFAFQIPMNGRKPFLNVSITGGDGSAGAYFAAFAILGQLAAVPSDAAGRGFTQELWPN